MKTALILVGSGLIGIVTTGLGYGWVSENSFSPRGAFVNVIAVTFWVLLITWIDSRTANK